jgi:tRNA A37 methylthiotransferase MiaB
MGRRPVVRELGPYLASLRKERPDLILRTDIIVGFPTATEQEDHETLAFVGSFFDEVAVHGFECFPRTPIAVSGLPFYPDSEVVKRAESSVERLKKAGVPLVHRGGQVYRTLEAIEKPKERMRCDRKAMVRPEDISHL